MTEQHEWKPCNTGENGCGGWVCRFHGLEPSLQATLNEYETLKKATDALSAEDAMPSFDGIMDSLPEEDRNLIDEYTLSTIIVLVRKRNRAYAEILERKDERAT